MEVVWGEIIAILPKVGQLGARPAVELADEFLRQENSKGRLSCGKILVRSDTSVDELAHEIGHWAFQALYKDEAAKVGLHEDFGANIGHSLWCRLCQGYQSDIACRVVQLIGAIQETQEYQSLNDWDAGEKDSRTKAYLVRDFECLANAFVQTVALPDTIIYKTLQPKWIEASVAALESNLTTSLWETDGYWLPASFEKSQIGPQIIALYT